MLFGKPKYRDDLSVRTTFSRKDINMGLGITLAENGLVPDFPIKLAIRGLIRQRLRDIEPQDERDPNLVFTEQLAKASIAEYTDAANDQHYEVPAEFFKLALGKQLKYSSCYYDNGAANLDQAEEDMLSLYGDRAQLKDGQNILDLGCGWGSFSLWAAERFPNSQIYGVSNSKSQRLYITREANRRGLKNVSIITADMNSFQISHSFDRIISIEMFEHMRNYEQLFAKVNGWLKDDGLAFIHVFSHKNTPYFYETEGDDNWMGRYFFTGGIMPSHQLYSHYSHLLKIEKQWTINGENYGKTSLAWLSNMDANRNEIKRVFAETYGKKEANIWFNRWRIFFLSCAELFSYNKGKEWDVSHFLFSKANS